MDNLPEYETQEDGNFFEGLLNAILIESYAVLVIVAIVKLF